MASIHTEKDRRLRIDVPTQAHGLPRLSIPDDQAIIDDLAPTEVLDLHEQFRVTREQYEAARARFSEAEVQVETREREDREARVEWVMAHPGEPVNVDTTPLQEARARVGEAGGEVEAIGMALARVGSAITGGVMNLDRDPMITALRERGREVMAQAEARFAEAMHLLSRADEVAIAASDLEKFPKREEALRLSDNRSLASRYWADSIDRTRRGLTPHEPTGPAPTTLEGSFENQDENGWPLRRRRIRTGPQGLA